MTLPCCGCGLKTGAKIVAIFQMSMAFVSFLSSIFLLCNGGGPLSLWEILLGMLIGCPVIFIIGYVLYLGINQNDLMKINISLAVNTLITVSLIVEFLNLIVKAEIRVEELPAVPIWMYIVTVVFYCRREMKQQKSKNATNPIV